MSSTPRITTVKQAVEVLRELNQVMRNQRSNLYAPPGWKSFAAYANDKEFIDAANATQ